MDVKRRAMEFAIKAHNGQVRKIEPEKDSVIHAIEVAKQLEKYGFDDNLVAAGYLHDVIEDTNYTKYDIKEEFGNDICSLVDMVSEEDENLSWEFRKKATINKIRNSNFRYKALKACDTICNSRNLKLYFGRIGKEDFSGFARGKIKKQWYWEELYRALIYNQDKRHPMFVNLRKNIDDVFNNKDNCKNIRELELKKLYYGKLELYDMMSVLQKLKWSKEKVPYVVGIFGNNNYVNIFIDMLRDFFLDENFKTLVIDRYNCDYDVFRGDYDLIFIDERYIDTSLDKLYINKNIYMNDWNINIIEDMSIDICGDLIKDMRNRCLTDIRKKVRKR